MSFPIDYVQVEECPTCKQKKDMPHLDDCKIMLADYQAYFEREERREAWNESFPG